MLEVIFGNATMEKVLLYLYVFEEAYIREISRNFMTPVRGVVLQLDRLEKGGVLVSQLKGKIRLYRFNPSYPFLKELRILLSKAYSVLPPNIKEKYYLKRTRPRVRKKL